MYSAKKQLDELEDDVTIIKRFDVVIIFLQYYFIFSLFPTVFIINDYYNIYYLIEERIKKIKLQLNVVGIGIHIYNFSKVLVTFTIMTIETIFILIGFKMLTIED